MGADKACSHPHQPGHTRSQSGHSHPEQPLLSSPAATTTRPGPLRSEPPNPRAHGTNPQSARHPALRTPGLTHPLRLRNLPAFQLGKLQGCRLRLRPPLLDTWLRWDAPRHGVPQAAAVSSLQELAPPYDTLNSSASSHNTPTKRGFPR